MRGIRWSAAAAAAPLLIIGAGVAWSPRAGAPVAEQEEATWPVRVLITNDDGIEDPGVLALARAFAGVAETYLVAPAADRSGSSSYASVLESERFEVERRDVGDDRITAYAVDGYPADCVLFAITGLMRDAPPDLVISGINGGSNLGDAWLLSGTVGAARMAAYLGIPAIAVSGVDDDDDAALGAVSEWTVRLAASPAARVLRPGDYLTVSLPVGPATAIRGVELTHRARGNFTVVAGPLDVDENREIWGFGLDASDAAPGRDTDVAALARGNIAIVAMRVGEEDAALASRLERVRSSLPRW